jgi:hypothetical protein
MDKLKSAFRLGELHEEVLIAYSISGSILDSIISNLDSMFVLLR